MEPNWTGQVWKGKETGAVLLQDFCPSTFLYFWVNLQIFTAARVLADKRLKERTGANIFQRNLPRMIIPISLMSYKNTLRILKENLLKNNVNI